MKKLMLLSVLLVALPQMTLVAQSVDDDLYFVPKKEKKTTSRGTDETSPAYRMESDRSTPAEVSFSSGEVRVSSSSPVVVTDASGVARDVDEYNRRYSYSNTEEPVNDTLYIEDVEEVADEGEWVNGFSGTEDDYEYATRLIRFRSPRVAVPVSSPLYWDIVYAWPVSDWNVYTDGFYAYAFPTISNPVWWSWRMDPWHWNYSWGWHGGWGFSFGWGAPWYDPWYSPWHYHAHYHHHHPHHGFGPVWGGGGHIGGGWRKGFYYDNRPRMASRSNAPRGNRYETGVRAIRGNDRGGASASRGSVATRENGRNTTATGGRGGTSATREGRQGRVVSGRSSDTAVRATTGRGFRIGDADDDNARAGRGQNVSGNNGGQTNSRQNGTTVRSGRSSSSNSSGNYTRSSSTRRSSTYTGSAASRSSRSSGNVSSSRRSSSGSYTRGSSSSSSRSSSGSYSSGSSSRSSSGSYSSGSSSRSSSGSYSSGGGSSRGSSSGGGGRSSGGGGGRSGGGRR
ncbi:MAG: hypothetical protein IJX44_04260 [Bacteroidaceae bacterium]|nr:hypothetical protein [Bacteroidaceae bacterium]